MTLDQIPGGESVFMDSNIFIYHFTGVSDRCTEFLMRCEQGDLNGVTSVSVLPEVLHRLMMVEVVKRNIFDPPNLDEPEPKRYPITGSTRIDTIEFYH